MLKRWGLFAGGLAAILVGGVIAFLTQTSGGIRVQDVRFPGANGVTMSALLYAPAKATANSPAPGVLAVHGYINSRETQDGFAIEFARRGYVVLAIDQTGHGYSGGYAFENGFGGPDGLKYLRGLDMVDKANIGLEGHSMGGGAILAAAKAYPNAYKAMVLEGSATGTLFSPPGDPAFPRNLAVVYSRFDEFSQLMWKIDRARDVAASPKLEKLFGLTAAAQPGQIYGSIAAGSARVLYTPTTTHPGDHISPEAIGDAADWFGKTLAGGTARPIGDQIWMWKEAGTLIAFAGFVALMLGAFNGLLALPVFASLVQPGAAAQEARGGKWQTGFWLTVLVPVITFYPFMLVGMLGLAPNAIWPQSITNQIMVWAVLNAVITLLTNLIFRETRLSFNNRWAPSIVIAVATVGIGYGALALADVLFKVDFRFWVVALKLMSPAQFRYALAYLIPFTAFFAIALRALQGNLMVQSDSAARQYATGVGAMALGFALFLAAEYIPLFVTDHLPIPAEALNAIVSIQFLPLMAVVGLISVFTWRRTNSYVPGALICGLFVTWYIVAGTAVQFRG